MIRPKEMILFCIKNDNNITSSCAIAWDFLLFAKLSSVKFSTSQIELRLALLSLYSHPTPHHPGKYI